MKILRTATLGIALLALGVTGANAGGPGERGSLKDVPYAAPTYVWTGLYVGGAVGYGMGGTEFSSAGAGNFADFNLGGTQGIATLGYDIQLNPRWVLGLFADLAFGEVKGDSDGGNVAIDRQWAVGGRL